MRFKTVQFEASFKLYCWPGLTRVGCSVTRPMTMRS